ncbi:ribbon-helix-helix domain-containing protein [Roseococcus sp.]|uniref:ribbon-helix-helix domain-containing protein n=1 Tax=Roseococcus sp. TaxID=2109646 RepID=UPI003BAC9280
MRHLAKRSVRLAGHATSIALEPAFWAVLEQAATRRGTTLAALIAEQDAARAGAEEPLASRLRVHALKLVSGEA